MKHSIDFEEYTHFKLKYVGCVMFFCDSLLGVISNVFDVKNTRDLYKKSRCLRLAFLGIL